MKSIPLWTWILAPLFLAEGTIGGLGLFSCAGIAIGLGAILLGTLQKQRGVWIAGLIIGVASAVSMSAGIYQCRIARERAGQICEAAEAFKAKRGRYPRDIEEMVRTGEKLPQVAKPVAVMFNEFAAGCYDLRRFSVTFVGTAPFERATLIMPGRRWVN